MPCSDRDASLEAFVDLVGREAWQGRIDAIVRAQPTAGQRTLSGRDVLRRHAIEVTIERQRRPSSRPAPAPERRIADLAREAVRLHGTLSPLGRHRLEQRLDDAMHDGQSLTPLFHLLRTAWLQRSRGFAVDWTCFDGNEPFDLAVRSDDGAAEIACDVVSAESGRDVHHGAWFRLVDLVDPDLRVWLTDHPGRYLLKMTLPQGLRVTDSEPDPCALATLHARIKAMLAERRRADQDGAAVMRLDPLALAPASTSGTDPGVLVRLRAQFGPETQLAVTTCGDAVFAMAAHAGGESDVPAAISRRMAVVANERLTGRAPGILAMFVDDIELPEWRRLERDMSLEGTTRHFLTTTAARHVVTVACTSRHELFHPSSDCGEHRFRNPSYRRPASAALAPSIASSCWSA